MLRQNLITSLILLVAALMLPRLCCCLHLSTSNEESPSSSHCCSSHSEGSERQTNDPSLSTLKSSCKCEHSNSVQNYVLSESESTARAPNVWVPILQWSAVEPANERYERLSYNQKRGPPDFISRQAKLTYIINQTILL